MRANYTIIGHLQLNHVLSYFHISWLAFLVIKRPNILYIFFKEATYLTMHWVNIPRALQDNWLAVTSCDVLYP